MKPSLCETEPHRGEGLEPAKEQNTPSAHQVLLAINWTDAGGRET